MNISTNSHAVAANATTISHAASREPAGALANSLALAQRELRDALRSRWFLLYTLAFTALGLAVSFVSAAGAGGTGLASFGRTTAGLINIILLVVPLMALTAGAGSIASDRERGMLGYILSQPVARHELLLGKFLGLAGALLASITLGLSACAGILAFKGGGASPSQVAWLCALAFLLALSMLSVGMLVSVCARKASVAVGVAIFVWLALVFGTDLGVMAGAVALRMRIENLFALAILNPLQVFKMWSLHAGDASLDVLGPAGLYATEEFGSKLHLIFGASALAWIAAPLTAAGIILSRRNPL